MFNIGDKIVYPNQGIGVISSIEEREFKGEKQPFYEIELLNNNMKSALPSSRVETVHIRLVSDCALIDSSLNKMKEFLTDTEELKSISPKVRMASTLEKLKSGTLTDYLSVVGDLTHIKIINKLNSMEQQTLKNVKAFVVEEISASKNLSKDEAALLLDKALNYTFSL